MYSVESETVNTVLIRRSCRFVDGDNLYDALHEKRVSFDFATRAKIARGVASGMAYMHCLPNPIIHRDLNSHNVLLFTT